MNAIVKYCILGVILLVMQILMTEFINIYPFLLLSVFPIFIATLPMNINYTLLMFIAAGYGLTVDIFTEGVIGINAAALTAMAVVLKPVMLLIVPKNLLDNVYYVMSKEISFARFVFINMLLCSVYLTVYLLLDSIGHSMFLYNLFRFGVNFVIDVIFWIFLEYIFVKQILK